MKIGIHHSSDSFSERWISYCNEKQIHWKEVDCYRSDIMQQLSDCEALMWHINQNNAKDNLFSKQLIYAVQQAGKKVFPDFQTSWHFDDKVGQKYLLEAIGAPLANAWIFYDRIEALMWAKNTKFPKVFKLRGGGGSQNVQLARTHREARKMINRAFHRGFPSYNAAGSLKERWRKFRLGRTNFLDLIKGVIRFIIPPLYARTRGREKGYIYFQEYIPDNTFDIRVIVIGEKAFAIKRMIREDDFRASGSGKVLYEKDNFSEDTVRLAFSLNEKLKSQSAAFDFVYSNEQTYVLEVSFGFIKEVYDPCTGYWDKEMKWHEGSFNPCNWMVDELISSIEHG